LEGIPTFFEKFYGYWNGEELVLNWGYQNPGRIKALGANLTRLDLKDVLGTENPQGQFRESDLRLVLAKYTKRGGNWGFFERCLMGNLHGNDRF